MMNKQFCRAKDKQIFDQFNKPLYLKGVGIGGWLLLEGYMIQSYNELDRPRRIKEHITKLVDAAYADAFFDQWVKRFFTKKDIDYLKDEGFNCIRIPIDYQFLFEASEEEVFLKEKEKSFALLDSLLAHCHDKKIYVILDLHAAPGGQTGTNIDNSKNNHPDLFTNRLYQEQTIYIWRFLANRYKEEDYIVAYDLLNEPLPNWFNQYKEKLYPLYQEIITAIRQVDPNHMITLEGLHWSTDLSIFSRLPDENILLQFHKYWSNPDQESIQSYLDVREQFQLPLLMGEGGENNLKWYSSVFKMYQQMDISFAFWTYKKMDLSNSLVSFQRPKNWSEFLQGSLSKEQTIEILDILLDSIVFEHCKYHREVSNHIFQRDDFETPAYAFDYEEDSFGCRQRHQTSMRCSKGLKICNKDGDVANPNFKQYNGEEIPDKDKLYLYLSPNEWANYSFTLSSSSQLDIQIDGENVSKLVISLDTKTIVNGVSIIGLTLGKGRHVLSLRAKDFVRLEKIQIKNVRPVN